MIRSALILFSLLSATPALAAGPHFQAEPVAASAQPKLALRDTLWKCGAAGCTAAASNSRPAIVCAVLAREVGALKSFSAGGLPLGAAELGKCNARAKKTASGAAAQIAAPR
jgi:hypothetical protein